MDKWCSFFNQCYFGNTCNQALTNEVKANFSNTHIETYESEPGCFEEKDLSIIENNNNG